MYDYNLLEALEAVVKERSFQKAARRLFITQSAVSQRIKQLEGAMGQPLIIRSPEISPTAAGQQCIAHFRQVRLLEDALARKCVRGRHALTPASLDVAVNAESLSTWFIGAIKETLLEGHLLLGIFAEDQEQTINLLRTGKVWGCVTSIAEPPYGCTSTLLGTMAYRLVCTPSFEKRYFSEGVNGNALLKAPAAIFGEKDEMHKGYLKNLFKAYRKGQPTIQLVPSAEGIVDFTRNSLAFALLPEVSIAQDLEKGRLVDLLPDKPFKLQLYWQTHELQTEITEAFSKSIVSHARSMLKP